jgi:hypothetical protein
MKTSNTIGRLFSDQLLSIGGCDMIPVLINKTVLRVRGVIFDNIEYVSNVDQPYKSEQSEKDIELQVAWIRQIWFDTQSHDLRSPFEPDLLLSVFLNIITLDHYQGDWSQWLASKAALFMELTRDFGHPDPINVPKWVKHTVPGDLSLLIYTIWQVLYGRKVVHTNRGHLGIAPRMVQHGDLCGIIFGCKLPCILRKTEVDGQYILIGSAFIPGKVVNRYQDDRVTLNVLGSAKSKDWIEWDEVEECYIDLV